MFRDVPENHGFKGGLAGLKKARLSVDNTLRHGNDGGGALLDCMDKRTGFVRTIPPGGFVFPLKLGGGEHFKERMVKGERRQESVVYAHAPARCRFDGNHVGDDRSGRSAP